ncbi:MAG: hypothetical protein NZM43_03385 [Saprospiraceae bacterium]|nr:hypothetical protein [Saprospiraceae bacterium]MDW8483347.1 hypothetical protein [Saprospiraceae bacterium]
MHAHSRQSRVGLQLVSAHPIELEFSAVSAAHKPELGPAVQAKRQLGSTFGRVSRCLLLSKGNLPIGVGRHRRAEQCIVNPTDE